MNVQRRTSNTGVAPLRYPEWQMSIDPPEAEQIAEVAALHLFYRNISNIKRQISFLILSSVRYPRNPNIGHHVFAIRNPKSSNPQHETRNP